MKNKTKPVVLLTNVALRRFCNLANKRYFGGRLPIAKISFSSRLRAYRHGRTFTCVYDVKQVDGRWTEFEMSHIEISSKLRRARDLCMMTVYHEMVHAELFRLGFYDGENSCRKSGARFNRRMTELAQAGAFNGLW